MCECNKVVHIDCFKEINHKKSFFTKENEITKIEIKDFYC